MPTKLYPTDVLQQAQETLTAWKQVDAGLALGPLNVGEIEANLSKAGPIQSQMGALEAQLTNLRNQRDELYITLWDQVKRARAGFKGIYGDDSSQYEMIGGTRRSERKRPTRKKVA